MKDAHQLVKGNREVAPTLVLNSESYKKENINKKASLVSISA
jgi:hypothetical protein